MNKYELALVVDAKIEEDARVATVEKAKDYVTKFGGTITEVEEWGKKRLAYEIQHMKEGYYYFIKFDGEATVPSAVGAGCSNHGQCSQILMRKTGSITAKEGVSFMNKVILMWYD